MKISIPYHFVAGAGIPFVYTACDGGLCSAGAFATGLRELGAALDLEAAYARAVIRTPRQHLPDRNSFRAAWRYLRDMQN